MGLKSSQEGKEEISVGLEEVTIGEGVPKSQAP